MNVTWDKFDSFLLEKISESRLPSVVAVLFDKNGEFLHARALGFKDIERGLPASLGTVYGVGSVTKSFTALAIMKLYEDGKLDIDDPVRKFIPEFKIRTKGEEIKIKHLLTHTSGLPALGYAEAYVDSMLGAGKPWLPIAKPEDLLPFLEGAEEWAVAKPGERFFYLNEGYALLGLIISRVSGMRYEDYVKKNILEPLDMRRSYFSEEEVAKDPDVAVPYILSQEGKHVRSRFPYGITADGGLLTNALDLTNYLVMFLNRGVFKDREILRKETVELMENKYVDISFKSFEDEAYGFGWIVTDKFCNRRLVSHGGNILVYTAYIGYLPNDGLGVAVLANASGYPLSVIGNYMLSTALGEDPERTLQPLVRERIYKAIEGVYESFKNTLNVTIERLGDYLKYTYRAKLLTQSIILIPEEIREDYARFYTTMHGIKFTAEFFIEKDRVVLINDRTKFIKKAPLT